MICPMCNGHKVIVAQTMEEILTSGAYTSKPCPECRGTGIVKETREK